MRRGSNKKLSRKGRRNKKSRVSWSLRSLDLAKALLELGPVLHDDLGTEFLELLSHLQLLVVIGVASNVGDAVDAGTDGAERTRLAVFDGNGLLRLLAALVKSVEVDGGVRLGGRLGQGAGSTENQFGVEPLVLAGLLDGSPDTAESGRRDDGHVILLGVVEVLQHLVDTDARLGLLVQLNNDLVLLLLDVVLELFLGQLELVLGLKRDHHTTEVLTDEVLDELRAGVAVRDATLLEDLIGEISTRLEGQLFREDEGVVAVEEKLSDLESCQLRRIRSK